MPNVVNHEVTNLMIPAFGSMRLFVNAFNPVNGYELEANSVTVEQVPFRPQSVTIDATDVPSTESVTFSINQIGYTKIVKGGNTVTFNFPSITNMIFTVLPTDGTSEVRAFFYNFPSFVDFDGVQQVEVVSGGGGVQDVNIVSPDPLPVSIAAPVTVDNSGVFTQTQATVTNAADTTIVANANRKYLLIQNNDAAGTLYVSLAGAANPTVANAFRILAGGSLELAEYVPTNAVTIRSSIASNALVIIAEG